MKQKQSASKLHIRRDLETVYQRFLNASREAESLKNEVFLDAEKAFDSISEGLRFGKVGFLDLLDVQRMLSEIKNLYIETFVVLHKALADVERLARIKPTGFPITKQLFKEATQ